MEAFHEITLTRAAYSHCPWIWNCGKSDQCCVARSKALILLFFAVGSGNHRQFLLFVATLVAGISLFDALAVACEFRFIGLAIGP